MRLSRRKLLATAGLLSGAAVVGTVGVGSVYRTWWDQPHDAETRHLSADELLFVNALADAIFPPSPNLPLRGREANVGRFMDLAIDGMEPFQRKLLRLSLHALDQWPRATHGKPFRELDEVVGAEVVAGWVGHSRAEVRGLIASVYIFVGMAYTVHPSVAPTFASQFRCGYGE